MIYGDLFLQTDSPQKNLDFSTTHFGPQKIFQLGSSKDLVNGEYVGYNPNIPHLKVGCKPLTNLLLTSNGTSKKKSRDSTLKQSQSKGQNVELLSAQQLLLEVQTWSSFNDDDVSAEIRVWWSNPYPLEMRK